MQSELLVGGTGAARPAAALGEILSLSPDHLRLVASLLTALSNGSRAVDRWIEERLPA